MIRAYWCWKVLKERNKLVKKKGGSTSTEQFALWQKHSKMLYQCLPLDVIDKLSQKMAATPGYASRDLFNYYYELQQIFYKDLGRYYSYFWWLVEKVFLVVFGVWIASLFNK